MKNKIMIAAICAALSVGFVGCVSPKPGDPGPGAGSNAVNVARVAAVIEMSSETAAIYLLKKQPDARPYLVIAASVIEAQLNAKIIDPQALREALAQIIESEDPDVWLAASTGLNIYRLYFAEVTARGLNQNEYILPAFSALYTGLMRALRIVPKSESPPPAPPSAILLLPVFHVPEWQTVSVPLPPWMIAA